MRPIRSIRGSSASAVTRHRVGSSSWRRRRTSSASTTASISSTLGLRAWRNAMPRRRLSVKDVFASLADATQAVRSESGLRQGLGHGRGLLLGEGDTETRRFDERASKFAFRSRGLRFACCLHTTIPIITKAAWKRSSIQNTHANDREPSLRIFWRSILSRTSQNQRNLSKNALHEYLSRGDVEDVNL
jgi:hypothetical protein